jgi:hypothetical protein
MVLSLKLRRDGSHVERTGAGLPAVGRRRRRAERRRRGRRRAALLRPLVDRGQAPRGGPEDLLPPCDLALVGLRLVRRRGGLDVPALPRRPPPAPLHGRRPRGARLTPVVGEADVEQDEAAAGGRGDGAAAPPPVPEQDEAEQDEEQGRHGGHERDAERLPHLSPRLFQVSGGPAAMYSRISGDKYSGRLDDSLPVVPLQKHGSDRENARLFASPET